METEEVMAQLRAMSENEIRAKIEECWMSYWKTHEKVWKIGAIALKRELMYRIASRQ